MLWQLYSFHDQKLALCFCLTFSWQKFSETQSVPTKRVSGFLLWSTVLLSVSRSHYRNLCFSLVNPVFSALGQIKRLQFWLPSSSLSWVTANCCLPWPRSWVIALYPLLQYSGFSSCFARYH